MVNRSKKAGILRRVSIAVRFMLLCVIGLAILLTLLLLLAASGKDLYGLVDPMVKWVPRHFQWPNYTRAFAMLGGMGAFAQSICLYAAVAAAQVISSAVIAYGFARYGFKGRGIFFGLMIATFFVPQQVLFLPRYVMFSRYGLLGGAWTVLLPAALGQGTKSAILILVFYQFMKGIPKALDEAALIDGAGLFKTFLRIDLPLAAPDVVISSVLSFAWNWNDSYFADAYFKGKIPTLTLQLANLRQMYGEGKAGTVSAFAADQYFHAGIEAAAALLTILPPLLIYIVLQNYLIESVDRVGITGE